MAKTHELCEEFYVETKDDEFVIKEKSVSTDGFLQFVASLNLEDLEAKPWSSFSVTDSTIEEAAKLALAGTGWTVGESTVTKRRNAGILQANTLEVLQKLCTAFMCEPVYDTKKKKISFYEETGEEKGVFFINGLNLKKLQRRSSSYDYYTRIIPIGENGLTIESVNEGKNYLENYQYSTKVKTYIWKDESYTDVNALKEDAIAKLEDLSKPEVSYSAEIVDLAKQKKEYGAFEFKLGDTIILIDAPTGIREKQRIVKMVQYPQTPEKDSCELGNRTPSFEESQEKLRAAQEIINTVVSDDGRYTGTINVSDILKFDEGVSNSSSVASLQGAVNTLDNSLSKLKLSVGEIETNYIKSEEADLKYAAIGDLKATSASLEELNGRYAAFETVVTKELETDKLDIKKLDADLADINVLMFGSASGDSIQTSFANAVIAQLGQAQIKSAMIEEVAAEKITSGDIITDKVRVKSKDGSLLISDSTIQISDKEQVRVQIGKDASNDYSINIWDEAGNLMFSKGGITDKAIKQAIIRNDMVSDDANISASKLDISSLFKELNEDGSHTLKSSKIYLDDESQTLDVAFTKMTSSVAETTGTANKALSEANTANAKSDANTSNINSLTQTVSSQGTQLSAVQGKITGKIWKEDITTEINNLEIGGRNLARKTSSEWSDWFVPGNKENSTFDFYDIYPGEKKAGDIFTLSFDVEVKQFTASGDGTFRLIIQGSVDKSWKLLNPFTMQQYLLTQKALEGDYTEHVSYLCTISEETAEATVFGFGLRCDYSDGTGKIRFKNFKVERGTKPTDWTPAPEDIQSDITSLNTQYTEAVQELEGLATTVAKHTTQISNKADNSTVTTVSDKVTKLETNLAGFKSTVSDIYATKTALAGTDAKVATAQSTADTAKANAASAQSTADTAKANAATAQKAADDAAAKVTQTRSDLDSAKKNLADVTSRVGATEEEIQAAQEAVNTAQAAADKAKADADKAQSTADKAKSDAATAQTTADTAKANAATAQATADKAKSTAEGLVTRMSSAETQIAQNATDINLRATKNELTEAVDGIQIGGRNLLLNTSDSPQSTSIAQYYAMIGQRDISELGLATGDSVTISVWIDNPPENTKKVRLRYQTWNDTSDRSGGMSTEYVSPGETKRICMTVIMTDKLLARKRFDVMLNNASDISITETVQYWGLKLEKGTKPTDWTPAPEDLASAEELSSLTTRVSEAEAEIDVHAGEIELKASKNELTTVSNAANKAQSTADTAKANAVTAQKAADDAAAKVTQTRSDLDSAKKNLADVTSRVGATEEEIQAAQEAVNTAQAAADEAKADADKAQSTADTAKANAATAQATADNVKNNLANNYYTKTQSDANLSVKSDAILANVKSIYRRTDCGRIDRKIRKHRIYCEYGSFQCK